MTNGRCAKFVAETRHRAPDTEGWQSADKAGDPAVNLS